MTHAFSRAFLRSFFLTPLLIFSCASVLWAQLGRPGGLYYKSWAVVVGIDDYLLAPKLVGSVADAKAAADALRKLGFDEVLEVYDKDASSRRLNFILTDYLPRKVGRQDRVVFVFAGHGGITKDQNGKDLGYLVPWDAQIGNVPKAVTMDQLKDFSRRVMSKHTFFILDTALEGWDVTPAQQLSLEGRVAPEEDTDKRAVQVLTAASRNEALVKKDGLGVFMKALVEGLQGAADENKNGWLMGTELGAYVKTQVEAAAGGSQHPQFARLDGDGDTIFIEGKRTAYRGGPEPKTQDERMAAAKEEYERAVALLQQQRSMQEVFEHLDKALEYVPTYGDALVLKSYVYLDLAPNIDKAFAAGEQAIKLAPTNRDSHYTMGLIYQRKRDFPQAEQAFLQALKLSPDYADVYLSLGDLYAEDLKDTKKALEAYRRYLDMGGAERRAKAYVEKAEAPASEPKP